MSSFKTNAMALAALAGTLAATGCAQPTRSVSYEQYQPQPLTPAALPESTFASNTNADNEAAQTGRIDAFSAADLERTTTNYDRARANGRAGTPSELNLFSDVVSQSLPTEVAFNGQSPDTANRTQVTFTHEGSDFDPVVTRDGGLMLFASTQHRPTSDIYARPIDSQVVTQLTQHPANDAMPMPSPDGQRIAFCSDRNGNWDIFIMPRNGGAAVQITHEGAHELHPSWSPNGQELVFSRLGEVSGRWELWTVNLANPGVAHFIGFGLFPEWCPVGGTGAGGSDKIVFQRARERGERAFSVWTLDYQNGVARNQSQVAFSNHSALINPTWSPDGQRVVYASVPNPSEWDTFEDAQPEFAALHMIDAFGHGQVTLTGDGFVDLMPFWSNENQVFFVSNRTGGENIWAVNATDAVFAATGHQYGHGNTGFANVTPNFDNFDAESNGFRAPSAEDQPAQDTTPSNAFANVPEPNFDD